MTPDWLARKRVDASRAARLRLCPRCRAPILIGLDADRCALTAHADPTPLDPTGEALALLHGRTTYDLTRLSGRLQLDHRETWHITAPRRHPVLPAHRCHQPLHYPTDTAQPAPTSTTHRTRPNPIPSDPPF